MNGMSLEGCVKLVNSKAKFSCSAEKRESFYVDYVPPLGDGEGYTSLELLLISLASCFASTVKFVLNGNFNITVDKLEAKASGKRKESHPTGFESILIDLKIRGENLTSEILENVIKTSEEILCPVYSMIKDSTGISVKYRILPPVTVSYCGVFCKSCPLYIGTTEEPQRLEFLSGRMGYSVEELKCKGCRSDENSYYCSECSLKKCNLEKGYEMCSKCPDFPCAELEEFQKQMPHRAELWESLDILKEEGYEKWAEKLTKDFSCVSCGIMNSAYDVSCRSCSFMPGSPFYERHQEIIKKHIGME